MNVAGNIYWGTLTSAQLQFLFKLSLGLYSFPGKVNKSKVL